MNYKSLNESILSVTNPQPKNEALTSLQENIDLYNAVLPYTVGLQSVLVLVMIETLLDGSGPISGTVSLFKNLMKKWKARVLGGKLSADEAQSFIAEYEKLAASLPTGKRNFLKASFNKMEQAAKAGDKGKLGAIATEVKDYLARNSAEVKEDYQTRERDRQMANTGQLGSALDSKEKASKKVYGKDGVVAHKSLRSMIKKANWKDEKNRLAVKEGQAYSGDPPYSGVERRAKSGPNQRATPSDRRPTGSAETEYNYFKGEYRPRGEQDRYYAKHRAEAKAKAKKTTTVKEERGGSPEDGNTGYGLPRKNSRFYPAKNKRPTGPGTEYHMETLLKRYEAKKAAEKLSALKQNRLDSKSVKEEREYTELLETIIVAIANELNISPQTLIEEFSEQELSEGLRKKIMHGLKVATTAAAILGGGVAGGLGMAKMRNDRLKNESPARQVERQKQEKISKDNWRKSTAHQAVPGVDNSSWIN